MFPLYSKTASYLYNRWLVYSGKTLKIYAKFMPIKSPVAYFIFISILRTFNTDLYRDGKNINAHYYI